MRVLMTAGRYTLSGAITVIENLSEQLSKKGVEVTVGTLSFKRKPPNGAFDVIKIPAYNPLKLKKFLDNFDVVHNHHPITNYLALLSNKPFIYHYHGAPDFGRGYLYRFSMLSSIKITGHRFDAVIPVSETGRNELKQYFNLNNMYVVYNGVNTNLFKPELEERFRKGTPQFLFVGNLYPHKMVEELILAFKRLVKAYPNAHLQIVGGGYTYSRLVDFVHALGLQKYVSFAGFVSHGELPYYYSSCDVYFTASRCELFPLPLLEAWACGKPIVASSIPSHTELLAKSKAGTTYADGDIEDLCNKMIKTYKERDRYTSNALRFSKKHDWSNVADRILKIYSSFVSVQ